jgi:tRNA(Ile)-lysidine synthase TilS/MesJ
MAMGGVFLSRKREFLPCKKISRKIGHAAADFSMIRSGDKIMVGLSGGKDSMLLLTSLYALMHKSPVSFALEAVTLDPTDGTDLSGLAAFTESLGVRHSIVKYPVFKILNGAASSSTCSLCANIRRGILASAAKDAGCVSLALGHHRDDAVETVFLNLLFAGRFRCFRPNMLMSRTGIRVIRPLIYLPEEDIRTEAARLALPVVDFGCRHAPGSKRAFVKSVIASLAGEAENLSENVLHALKNFRHEDTWGCASYEEDGYDID